MSRISKEKTGKDTSNFLIRFFIYQKERFPFLAHGVLIGAFTFSAIAYSRICRDADGFIPWSQYLTGMAITTTLFFMIRIFDEFKDRHDDARYRTYLPVPRGLISLRELMLVGVVTVLLQIVMIALVHPEMFLLYALVMVYLLLMRVEFFVPEWLKTHQLMYIASHMIIIPLIDLYASGLDWLLQNETPHPGLAFFFGVSFLNGVVLEFGRKIKPPQNEEEGVVSYSGMYGAKGGTLLWIATLFCTLVVAVAASFYAGYGIVSVIILGGFFILCSTPGWMFIAHHTPKRAKYIEYASALWTVAMYLTLGGGPKIAEML